MHKTLQIPICLSEGKAKKYCKLQRFWRAYSKTCLYFRDMSNVKKTWKARNTVDSGVLTTFGHCNASIYAVFGPWRRQPPVNYSIFGTFWADFFLGVLMTVKNAGMDAFFKKSKMVTCTKPCKQQCFSHAQGLKLWYLCGFLPSDNTKCCKLQHFVRFWCSIFERALLFTCSSHSSTRNNVQAQTGLHNSVYTQKLLHSEVFTQRAFTHRRIYTQKLLHRGVFTQRSFYAQELFTHRSLYTQKFLHPRAFTQRNLHTHRSFYTEKSLHRVAFTHRSFYTEKSLHRGDFTHRSFYTERNLYTEELLHREACIHRRFYTEKSLHGEVFARRGLYTDKSLHREVFTQTNLYTEEPWHREACTHRSFYTEKSLHTDAFTHKGCKQRSLYT